MASAELRLALPVDPARDAVAAALADQGFETRATDSGSLEVTRGAADDETGSPGSPARFDVHVSEVSEGTLVVFENAEPVAPVSGAAGGDDVREAARLAGARLAQQGLLAVAEPVVGAIAPIPPAPMYTGLAASAAPGYPGSAPGPVAPPYGAPAYGTAPAGAVTPGSERTNPLSIVAIITGFLFPVAGIITGAVALAQVKRSGEKGRGLALGGLIAGSVLTALTFIGSLVFVIAVFIGVAQGETADPYGQQEGGVTVAPDEQAPVDPSAIALGACLDSLPGGVIGTDNVVDCAQPHAYEIFHTFDVADAAFPGDEGIVDAAYTGCEAAFPAFVGVEYQNSTLDYYFVGPTEQTWAGGDREIACLLYDPSTEESVGSLQGSGL